MGVEALLRDRFLAAREYAATPVAERKRDLELDALAEILAGERLIHCHSYRQDEILMLCRVAKEFGFRIGTFQHVLEGYKVAEAIREHAIGGSAFSDWWAYKVEVQDAIPQNGALMHEVGVVVSFNSDSNDLVRRLNVEAAKAVKYGGVSPEEALKFVTLNPAKQLRIDDRVGSLETGKDADFALWSASPLSVYAKCVATWIDGRRYFSIEDDAAMRERIRTERARLLAAAAVAKEKKRDKDRDREKDEPARRRWILERLRTGGGSPWDSRCGECGCMPFEEER
jgi:imidazolonepropionase-like amidohydrolase